MTKSKNQPAKKQDPKQSKKPAPKQAAAEPKQEEVKVEETPKQEEVKVEETPKQEEEAPKPELLTEHPDMCMPEIFGTCDEHNKECQDCQAQFTECYNACKALADSKKTAAGATPTRTRASSTKKSGTNSDGTRGKIRGEYRTRSMRLNQVGRPGSKSNTLSSAIFNAGSEGVAVVDLIKVADFLTEAFVKAHVRYYTDKEGFNVVIEGGRVYDRTEYTPAAAA